MHLTPLEIRKQTFRRSFRGFDPDEVSRFLEMVAGELETLISTNSENAGRLKTTAEKLQGYEKIEQTLKDTLIMARKISDDSRVNAQKEAELIIKDATVRGHEVEQEIRNRIAKLENELASLKNQRDTFLERFKGLLTTQLNLLGTISGDLHDRIDGKDIGAEVILAEADETAAASDAASPAPETVV
jgi:cell division initiation protein